MTVTRTRLDERRVVFDCPVCGVHHDGPLSIVMEGESGDWETPGGYAMHAYLRQTLATSACADLFTTFSVTDEPVYNMKLITHTAAGSDRPAELHVTPRATG